MVPEETERNGKQQHKKVSIYSTSMAPTRDDITSMEAFQELLASNPGIVILKFGADWCGPCKKIAPTVHEWFTRFEPLAHVQTVMVDVDESVEVYGFLTKKKMIKGVPALLMYKKGNLNYTCDDMVNTSDQTQVDAFFNRCCLALNDVTTPLTI